MKKCQEIVSLLAANYLEYSHLDELPALQLHFSQGKNDTFSSKYEAGAISLYSTTRLSQASGIAQVVTAVKAGHLAEYLGDITPKFRLRPLWLESDTEVAISDLLSVNLPSYMLDEGTDTWLPILARRMIELGYNAIMLGSRRGAFVPTISGYKVDVSGITSQLEDYGIATIIKPNICLVSNGMNIHKCPFDPEFCSELKMAWSQFFEFVGGCKKVFWESMLLFPNYRFHSKARDATEVELVLQEVRLLEECTSKNADLIFYIPTIGGATALRQAEWIPSLMDDMGKRTILSFSALEGGLCQDHLLDHPLWNQLRQSPDTSATPLLPIVNFGSVDQGEGLWAASNFDLIERFLSRCRRHAYLGVMGIVNHLPAEGSLLDLQLWVAGQSLWRDLSPNLLAETWYKAFRSFEDSSFSLSALKSGRSMLLEMGRLRLSDCNEKRRHIGELLLAQLRNLSSDYEKHASKVALERPSLKDYFDGFSSDIRRFLEQTVQLSYRPVFGAMGTEELQPSFWTHPRGRGDFLVKPQHGAPGSVMEAIFRENRLL